VKYTQGSFGRVFLLKFEDKDDLLSEIKRIATTEMIKAGTIMLLGGMRSAGLVSGPKEATIPPEPMWNNFNDGREVLGFGTLFWNGNDPVIHLHGAVGRDNETLMGCIRKECTVYLVVEAVIMEIVGIFVRKTMDKNTGVVTLDL
jgi:predicted DNA-binding protein with PD1-like motif